MSEQAPEPQVLAKLLRAIAGGTDAQASKHDVIFLAAANWLERWNTRPTPSERPVAQVREALEIAQEIEFAISSQGKATLYELIGPRVCKILRA